MKLRNFKPELQPRPRLSDSEQSRLSTWLQSHVPIILEIGAGNGEFATNFAQANPETNIIAIEHTRTRASAHKNRLASENLPSPPNLLFLHANAIGTIAHHIPENRIQTIYLLYPNPYPKKSDHHSRWFHLPFFSFLITRLQPSGKIHLASNIPQYLEDALECSSYYKIELESRTPVTQARTAFERKYTERGEQCEEFVFRRL